MTNLTLSRYLHQQQEQHGVSPELCELIRQTCDACHRISDAIGKGALAGVAKEGTSARAFTNAGYVSAGKTGTAQVFGLKGEKYVESRVAERLRDHAWYIAYAPAEAPTIALAILVENGGFGAAAAAPIARAAFDYHLLGKQPDAKVKKLLDTPDAKNAD